MNSVAETKTNGNTAQLTRTEERPFVAPDVNIYETDEGYVIQAEMPGVAKDGIDVTLENNTLSFVGRRADEQVAGSVLYPNHVAQIIAVCSNWTRRSMRKRSRLKCGKAC